MRRPTALAPLVLALHVVGCASSSSAGDAGDAGDAGRACEESLAAWCSQSGHLCVQDLRNATSFGSPFCQATWGATWVHSGCAGYDEIVVGDTVDHVTRYVYDTKANTLVAVMEQTTIIETCLAGESWIAPPRSCDDPRNDPQTCCRPSPAGGLTCDAPQDAGP